MERKRYKIYQPLKKIKDRTRYWTTKLKDHKSIKYSSMRMHLYSNLPIARAMHGIFFFLLK